MIVPAPPETPSVKSAVTISLVPEAARGPFVFDCSTAEGLSLAAACQRAADLGFDAIEIFPSDAENFPREEVGELLAQHSLALAAVGTGAGWLRHGLSLSAADPVTRARAIDFVRGMIEVAAERGAPAIIGSMQGRAGPDTPRPEAIASLADSLRALSAEAAAHGQVLLYEPLNRYETDLFNRQADAAAFLDTEGLRNVKLLCDLFHMNIEEADLPAALTSVGAWIGHVHWADSNRLAVGTGHTPMRPVVAALAEVGFLGYLSAEVFPLPTADAAARASIESFLAHTPRA
jgi:sugar phosphate isomerase/epimerase